MNSLTKKIGQAGEEAAAAFLQSKGYEIIARNFRAERGEIDIICKIEKVIVFVEVKTARTGQFGAPETWVTIAKQKQIGKVAAAFLQQIDIDDFDCRFDVVAIDHTAKTNKIRHLENAFWLT